MDRYVWLHGFASGPKSSKGQYVRARLAERGHELALPDLNEPAFFELTITRMLSQLDAIAGSDSLILFGSSLGGIAAATWAATRPGRTKALVLLAPAFDLGPRWSARMPPRELAQWRSTRKFAFDHYARGRKEDLSIAFLDDAMKYSSYPLPDCPTLVIQGTQDETVTPDLAHEFARRMGSRAQLVLLPEGHELTGDLPALWATISDFLAQVLPTP
jgi:pimeloyl-ACP methyl ester carboxylesterase